MQFLKNESFLTSRKEFTFLFHVLENAVSKNTIVIKTKENIVGFLLLFLF